MNFSGRRPTTHTCTSLHREIYGTSYGDAIEVFWKQDIRQVVVAE